MANQIPDHTTGSFWILACPSIDLNLYSWQYSSFISTHLSQFLLTNLNTTSYAYTNRPAVLKLKISLAKTCRSGILTK